MNTIQLTEAVAANAAKDYDKTEAVKSMGIDFCCNDDKMQSEASTRARITEGKMITTLEQIPLKRAISSRQFDKWELDSMIDYIINTHHQYAKENAVIIYNLAQKVAFDHSENHPGLVRLTTTMFLFLHDLLNCMKKEEQTLFPSIKQLVGNNSHSRQCRSATFGLIKEWVSLMHKEHQASVKDLKLFHELTNGYMLPGDACNSYKCLFEKMKEFEDDLFLHLHLENNILFPKAIALSEELNKINFR